MSVAPNGQSRDEGRSWNVTGFADTRPGLRRFLRRCRLCLQIAATVFVAIVTVEAVILMPSYRSYERDLLRRIESVGRALIGAEFRHVDGDDPADLAARLRGATGGSELVGVALYRPDGAKIGEFGEAPALAPSAAGRDGPALRRTPDGRRLDVVWPATVSGLPVTVVGRLDSAWVGDALRRFTWRIIGLVLLISIVVCAATMYILDRRILGPLLRLRDNLLAAGDDPGRSTRYALPPGRDDELGDLYVAFNDMLRRIEENVRALSDQRERLATVNAELEDRVAERTRQLTEANAALRAEIAERKAKEAALTESEQRLKALTENVPGIVYQRLLKADGGVEYPYVAGSVRALLGCEAEDIMADPTILLAAVHPDDRARYEAAMRRSAEDLTALDVEFRAKTPADRVVWLRALAQPHRLGNGDTLWNGIAIDVTERKRVEKTLRISEQRYRALYNDTPAMLHSINHEGRIISVSNYWLRKLGYSRSEVIGRKSTDFLTESSRRFAEEFALPQFKTGGRVHDVPYQFVTKDGEVLDVLLSAVAERDENGEFQRFLAVLSDVTERKRAEEKLLHVQKMEAVGQLTGGVAHDFNNLLAVIRGNLELIAEHAEASGLAAALDDLVGPAIRAADRGAELTQRLLAFSRKQVLQPRLIDPNELIRGLLELVSRTLGETVVVETRLDDALPKVRTDPAQLENALLNLALNARDAMPGGGRLTFATGTARLDRADTDGPTRRRPGDYVVLSVADTGVGMTPEVKARAFDPFFTTKEVGSGSGLGLSMVYGFAEQSGGFVSIDTAVGKGSTIRIYLPEVGEVATSADTALFEPATDDRAEPRGSDEIILVVEDDPDVRSLAVLQLESLGYRVIQAANGESALDAVETAGRIDLLFTDVVLPGGMSGPEIAEAVRRRRPEARVLFMSGYSDGATDGIAGGDWPFLQKPFRKGDLARMVRRSIERAPA